MVLSVRDYSETSLKRKSAELSSSIERPSTHDITVGIVSVLQPTEMQRRRSAWMCVDLHLFCVSYAKFLGKTIFQTVPNTWQLNMVRCRLNCIDSNSGSAYWFRFLSIPHFDSIKVKKGDKCFILVILFLWFAVFLFFESNINGKYSRLRKSRSILA